MSISIAIIGLHGALGQPTLDAINSGIFDNKLRFPIKALTRKETSSTDKIQYIKTEINSQTIDSIANELVGTDVIIELVSPKPELFSTLEKVAEKVKPKLYIPSQFGCDIERVSKLIPGFLAVKTQHSKNLRDLQIKTVDIITNFFAQPGGFLYKIGVDPTTNTVVQIGSIDTKLPYTKVQDIGKIVLTVATTPTDQLPNTLRVKSGDISFREIIEKYESTNNVNLSINEVSLEQGKAQLHEKLNQSGGFDFKDFLFYLHVAAAVGLEYDDQDNELINPGQSLWKWLKF